jgi:NitT/TauT family transport system substrate-binding protein
MADELLRAEGFPNFEYVRLGGAEDVYHAIAAGGVDLSMAFSSGFVLQADSGAPITMLAGVHPGCQELIASTRFDQFAPRGRSVPTA